MKFLGYSICRKISYRPNYGQLCFNMIKYGQSMPQRQFCVNCSRPYFTSGAGQVWSMDVNGCQWWCIQGASTKKNPNKYFLAIIQRSVIRACAQLDLGGTKTVEMTMDIGKQEIIWDMKKPTKLEAWGKNRENNGNELVSNSGIHSFMGKEHVNRWGESSGEKMVMHPVERRLATGKVAKLWDVQFPMTETRTLIDTRDSWFQRKDSDACSEISQPQSAVDYKWLRVTASRSSK